MGDKKDNKKKIRAEFRKNRAVRTRRKDLTRELEQGDEVDAERQQRIGKDELTRKRIVVGAEADAQQAGFAVRPDVDPDTMLRGRVLRVLGLLCDVEDEQGVRRKCATRRLLKTLVTEQRHVIAAGDIVWFRPAGSDEGIIERVEPRHGVLSRSIRGRQQVLVSNVDQLVIVASAAEPRLKPNLIDRFLATAEKSKIHPLICINKIDLVEPADLQPLVGVYSQMGYRVELTSATCDVGTQRLRQALAGRQSVVVGQSGVGKSSLLNAVEPGLGLRVAQVSAENQKGRHTTTTAQLIPLELGGYVVDTPGIRQFQLWDVVREELPGYWRDMRPYVSQCRFPDCTHTHEQECAVKDAVADGRLDARRYESYVHLVEGDLA